ncbi:MAG: MBL fold metallo-hydrolase [Planctomycetota bacterium]
MSPIAQLSYPEGVKGIRLATFRSRTARLAVYVFRAGPFLIDAGARHAGRQLLRWPGIEGAQACLLTHHDEDHVGNGAALARRGIRVKARPEVIAELAKVRPLPAYRRWVWGTADPGPVDELRDAASASGWNLVPIHTPGHCEDHFVYHEPDRKLIFSGDLFVARHLPVAREREDLDALLASLRRVRDLNPVSMFCAHRGPVSDPVEALSAKIDWLEDFIAEVKRLAEGGLDPKEIVRQVLGGERPVAWVSRGEYCSANLVNSALRAGQLSDT